jgi:hypothetical protein
VVHHIHGVIEERVGVLYSTKDNDHNCWGLAPRVHLSLHLGKDWQIFSGFFSVCRFVDSIFFGTNKAYTCKYYLSDK